MAILVTGGAGYIGSHTVLHLMEKGEEVIVLDHLHQGHRRAVLTDKFYEGDISDSRLLKQIFNENNVEAVIHFAAFSLVGESMQFPLAYYRNNVLGTYQLVNKLLEYGIKFMVFSSTAATYGNPVRIPIQEEDPALPTNPYGETKLAIERMLKWAGQAHGLKFVSLRYFNAAGADPKGRIGEDHHPETHLIPLILQTALGQRENVSIFGEDYPTDDGTCVRDYIHVMDLAAAHYLALKRVRETSQSGTYNLGNGQGFSVKEVIDTCRKVTGEKIETVIAPRRPGDPPILIASSDKAKKELVWEPQYSSLETIVQHAWNWHKKHPHGFGDNDNEPVEYIIKMEIDPLSWIDK